MTSNAGRPTLYSDDLGEAICARLEAGETVVDICAADDMPGVRTVLRWAREHETFSGMYADARAAQAEQMDKLILAKADGVTDRETALAARVQIEAYKWRAGKLSPRTFGDSTMLKHADADGGRIQGDAGSMAARLASIAGTIRERDDK